MPRATTTCTITTFASTALDIQEHKKIHLKNLKYHHAGLGAAELPRVSEIKLAESRGGRGARKLPWQLHLLQPLHPTWGA